MSNQQKANGIKLIANSLKRLRLPGYSSHQFSISVEIEITNINDVAAESTRLYQTLQQSVDEEIQQTGFVPDEGYGIREQGSRNGSSSDHAALTNGSGDHWTCSDKQLNLVLKVIGENNLDKADIEILARDRFSGKGVKQLNKLEVSGLIDEMLERVGQKPNRGSKHRAGSPAYQGGCTVNGVIKHVEQMCQSMH